MRTFIAIELPSEIKAALANLQTQLKTANADVKWVLEKNIHITLKFIGERDEKKVNSCAEALSKVANNHNPFTISLSNLGAFPNTTSPRVIWTGILKGESETKKIAQELEEEICRAGIPKESREFSSHVTLGRTRSSINLNKLSEILNLLGIKSGDSSLFGKSPFIPGLEDKGFPIGGLRNAENNPVGNLEFVVNKLVLFKSTLTPKGPVYEIYKEASLKTT
ncbi:MAG: RNA 2',3'-cyclic phosphodiesterase [Candidatus Omnitrophica bacterium]|nr:RNA 2',3'-cyclic phosphodiesterase [Candidatus Omnitrophota bacterium]